MSLVKEAERGQFCVGTRIFSLGETGGDLSLRMHTLAQRRQLLGDLSLIS